MTTTRFFSAMAAAASMAWLSLGALGTPAHAAPHATLTVQSGAAAHGLPVYQPPYAQGSRYGHRPHPGAGHGARPGHTWVAGHWQQRGPRAVWREGHWERIRPGQRPGYRPGHGAVHRPGSAVHPHASYGTPRPPRWDRDGDGVPNRHDRRPHNPYRY